MGALRSPEAGLGQDCTPCPDLPCRVADLHAGSWSVRPLLPLSLHRRNRAWLCEDPPQLPLGGTALRGHNGPVHRLRPDACPTRAVRSRSRLTRKVLSMLQALIADP